jgi:glycosyltransferase involved in cell wall biosynthesis
MGLQPDSRAWFATADVGLLPTFFACESQPLTLIECLQAGRPYLASEIGEIKSMLSSPEGPAGMTIPLRDGKADADAFAQAIMSFIQEPELLTSLQSCCAAAAAKFSWQSMLQAYMDLYASALQQPMR